MANLAHHIVASRNGDCRTPATLTHRRQPHRARFQMPTLHARFHATRIVCCTIAAVALLAAMSAAAAAEPLTSAQFASGWQAHTKPLINMGFATRPNRDKWYVPPTLARGDYVLVQRTGETARVIEGYRFTVSGGNTDQYIFLDPGLGDVEAIPVSDVPALKQGSGGAWVR
jgi:hypothetical protein